jgi:hypothetical protein
MKPCVECDPFATILAVAIGMSFPDISRKILAAVMLVALLIATTPALALALSPQDSQSLMDCCKDGLCPMHQHKSNGETNECSPNSQSSPTQSSMRACDPAPNFALGMAVFVLAAPVGIGIAAPMSALPVARISVSPIIVSTPPSPPPRARFS